MRRPRSRRPLSTGWQKAECDRCAAPILIVVDDLRKARIEVNVLPYALGTVAVRLIGNQNHGFLITPTRPLPEGYNRFRLHVDTCDDPPEPDHVQEALFNQPEGPTHP